MKERHFTGIKGFQGQDKPIFRSFKNMKLVSYSATDVGLVRKNNQDSILTDENNQLFIVADGMGGHQGGEVASRLAVETISKKLTGKIAKNKSLAEDIRSACLLANKVIYNEGQKKIELRGMGTTVCLLLVRKDGLAYIANIGDSRLYMQKHKKIWLLTEDHNFITSQMKASFLSGEEPPEPTPENSALTKSVGFFTSVDPDIFERQVEKGEKYLICSDGLSSFVPDAEINAILQTTPLQNVPKVCIKKALSAGGDDNVSVIVVEVQ